MPPDAGPRRTPSAPPPRPRPPRRPWLLIAGACLFPAVLDAFRT